MKKKFYSKNKFIFHKPLYCLWVIILLSISGCSTANRSVAFSSLQWKVNDSTKYLHDPSFNWVLTSDAMDFSERNPIIATDSALRSRRGLDRYLADVISDIPFSIDSVLLYLPLQKLVFATYSGDDSHVPPVSYIVFDNTGEKERHYSFLNEYPDEIPPRDNKWMFGNVFPNKKKQRCVIAYRFPYNDTNMVVLKIEQGHNSEMERLTKEFGLQCTCCHPISHTFINPLNPEYAEPIGWDIEKAKKIALKNLNLGERLKSIKQKK